MRVNTEHLFLIKQKMVKTGATNDRDPSVTWSEKPISKEQLLVSWSFIAFNMGEGLAGMNETQEARPRDTIRAQPSRGAALKHLEERDSRLRTRALSRGRARAGSLALPPVSHLCWYGFVRGTGGAKSSAASSRGAGEGGAGGPGAPPGRGVMLVPLCWKGQEG